MRSSAKWILLGVGLLVVSALTVGVILVLVIGGARVPSRSVLVVRASGQLLDHDSRSALEQALGGEIDTLQQITASIDRASRDERVRAIRLEVGDMEAGWGRAQELRDALAAFRASGKPVIAHLETAGTVEYYLASVSSKVYLMPGGMLMATGLLADAMFLRGTLEKLKITPDFEHIGEYKSASDMYMRDSMSEAQRRATDSILDSLYTQMVEAVASSRKLAPAQVTKAIDAGLLTPGEAEQSGLVDGLLYIDQVEDEIRKEIGEYTDLRIRSYKKSGGLRLGGGRRIAVVNATGTIVSGRSGQSSFGGEFVGSDSLSQILRDIRDDDGILAVILRVDSPGGSGIASDAIWRETQLLKQEKPLIVSMGDVAASGGYYISMGATAIVADPATITGSIGVIAGKFNMRGFYEDWLGLKREQLKRGENADLFSDYDGFTGGQRVRLRAQIQDFYQSFVHKVAEGRGKKDEEIERIAQGRVWTGAQAKDLGLVDELGGLARAVEIAKEKAGIPATERVVLEPYPRRKGLLDMLTESDETALAGRVQLPLPLGRALSTIEIQDRISRDGPVLWIGETGASAPSHR